MIPAQMELIDLGIMQTSSYADEGRNSYIVNGMNLSSICRLQKFMFGAVSGAHSGAHEEK